MKKNYQKLHQKNLVKRRQKKTLKNTRRNKAFKKRKSNRSYKEKTTAQNNKPKVINNKPKVIKFEKGFNFSFVENTEKLLQKFNNAKEYFKKLRNIKFNLSQITNVTPDAIALYIALCTDKKFINNQSFKGNLPKNEKLKIIFVKCGFFDYVNSKIPKGLGTQQIFNVETNKKVEPKIAEAICTNINKEEKNKALYKILIELMANTNNHASGKSNEQEKYHWCFQSYYDDEKEIYKCSFIDVGVGIFQSIPVKEYKKKKFWKEEHNKDLFKRILDGKIKNVTITEKKNRGKGIPLIYKTITEGDCFLRAIVITNDVFACIKGDKVVFKKLNNPFQGTFYYWEIKNKL